MISFLKKIGYFFILILLLLSFLITGFFIGRASVFCEICPPQEVDLNPLWEAWELLEKKYIDFELIDKKQLIHGAISGMVKALGDPYTSFFNEEETKVFLDDTRGVFEGVGIEIGIREEQLQVITPIEGTPAHKAGLRSGDKIIEINGDSTRGITIEEAVSLIRGPRGTLVILTISRTEWREPREIEIKRGVIEIPSLRWEIIEHNGNKIAHIKFIYFSEKSSLDFSEAVKQILDSSADRVVLDLRSNPGGYLDQCKKIAGWFLKKDDIIVIEDKGNEYIPYKAKDNGRLSLYPVVVLVNQGSASASEILAFAIRDNLGSKIVGEKTFGKASVQEFLGLRDGSSLKISVSNWLTPKGEMISEIGLTPDLVIEMTEEDYEQERDPQLDAAIELISEIR